MLSFKNCLENLNTSSSNVLGFIKKNLNHKSCLLFLCVSALCYIYCVLENGTFAHFLILYICSPSKICCFSTFRYKVDVSLKNARVLTSSVRKFSFSSIFIKFLSLCSFFSSFCLNFRYGTSTCCYDARIDSCS